MKNASLIAHCGAHAVDRQEVFNTNLPVATASYQPVHHGEVIELAEHSLNHHGYTIAEEAHVMTREGLRYFGLMRFTPDGDLVSNSEFELIVGLRNSYDKSFAIGYAWGSRVFVCDNLAFNGEQVLSRKHTTHVKRDLPDLMGEAISKLRIHWEHTQARFNHYKGFQITDLRAEHVIVEAVRRQIVPASKIGLVINEWDNPTHPEFVESGKSVWRLYNAFTENQKGAVVQLPERTQKLQRICDEVSDLKLAA